MQGVEMIAIGVLKSTRARISRVLPIDEYRGGAVSNVLRSDVRRSLDESCRRIQQRREDLTARRDTRCRTSRAKSWSCPTTTLHQHVSPGTRL